MKVRISTQMTQIKQICTDYILIFLIIKQKNLCKSV